MEQSSIRASWERFWYEFSWDMKHMSADVEDWLGSLSAGDAVLGLCLFTLALLFIMIRRPKNYKQGGGMSRQFVLALAVVIIFGFGSGYLLEGWTFISDRLS